MSVSDLFNIWNAIYWKIERFTIDRGPHTRPFFLVSICNVFDSGSFIRWTNTRTNNGKRNKPTKIPTRTKRKNTCWKTKAFKLGRHTQFIGRYKRRSTTNSQNNILNGKVWDRPVTLGLNKLNQALVAWPFPIRNAPGPRSATRETSPVTLGPWRMVPGPRPATRESWQPVRDS